MGCFTHANAEGSGRSRLRSPIVLHEYGFETGLETIKNHPLPRKAKLSRCGLWRMA
jgi:hypothetical protein